MRQAKRDDAQVRGVGGRSLGEVQAREVYHLTANVVRNGQAVIETEPIRPSYRNKTDAYAEAKWTLTSSSPRIDSYSLLALAIFSQATVVAQWGYVAR